MKPKPRITVLGTGLMGFPMSVNLLKAGFDLTVWNRTKAKASDLSAHGAQISETAADAVSGSDVIISMLADGTVSGGLVRDERVQTSLSSGQVWIEMSSIKPAEARAQADILRPLGVDFLDAPVSGGTKGAEDGTLAIMVGGEQSTFHNYTHIFNALGRAVHVGPTGAGQLAKLANQAIVAITISAVAEATLLLETGGADSNAVRDALKGGFADSTILQQHGARMSNKDFEPGGLSESQLKDLDNVLEEAAALDLRLPSTKMVRDRFAYLVHDLSKGKLDHSALFLELEHQNRHSQ